jgi:hypothetical protein
MTVPADGIYRCTHTDRTVEIWKSQNDSNLTLIATKLGCPQLYLACSLINIQPGKMQ